MKEIKSERSTVGVWEPGDPVSPPGPTLEEEMQAAQARAAGVDWAKNKKEKENADAADATVAGIINDVRAVIVDDKALIDLVNAGALTNNQRDAALKTLAKGQKALARAVLYLAKGEKSNI